MEVVREIETNRIFYVEVDDVVNIINIFTILYFNFFFELNNIKFMSLLDLLPDEIQIEIRKLASATLI